MKQNRLTTEQQEEIVTLIQENKVKLIGYIRKNFKDISDSDIKDCFQNLFLRTYEKYFSFQHSLNKVGWLFKTMKNILHEFCREKKKMNENILPLSYLHESTEEYNEENDIIFEIVTNHLSEEQIIQVLISVLNEKDQMLYQLRCIEKLSTHEIADKLSMPSGTVRAHLSKIKRKLSNAVRNDQWLDFIQKEKFSKNCEHLNQN